MILLKHRSNSVPHLHNPIAPRYALISIFTARLSLNLVNFALNSHWSTVHPSYLTTSSTVKDLHRVSPPPGSLPSSGLIKSCPTLATPWTVACQAPLYVGFSRQEYWSGLLFPSPGALPDPGIESRSPALQADSLPTELQGSLSSIRWFPVPSYKHI